MKFFLYKEFVKNNNEKVKLNKKGYSDYIEEYMFNIDKYTGVKSYVVSVDLNDSDLVGFLKQQEVKLETIPEEQFNAIKSDSNDYKEKRENVKLVKIYKLETSIVIYNGLGYQANDTSLSRLSAKISYYNFKFNQMLANGKTLEEAYSIYDEVIPWVDSTNVTRELSIKDLINIQQMMLSNLENIVMNG